MIENIRRAFNERFEEAQYGAFLADLEASIHAPSLFRIAETPVFVSAAFKEQLLTACEEIFDSLLAPDFVERTDGALAGGRAVPNQDEHSVFMQLDFGVCRLADGTLAPRLIEIQGFPSLYFLQAEMVAAYRRMYPFIPAEMSSYFHGYDRNSYINLLGEVILNGHAPGQVVLLEIDPERQATNIDFYATERALGLKILNLSDLKRTGRRLYYLQDGREVTVKRIYNRVIFDELDKYADRQFAFNFTEEVDVEWAGHPNWFFRISKYTLPLIKSAYVPRTHFLHELKTWPTDLENFVLKPLFSFAGLGVKINITSDDLEAVPVDQRHLYILQEKVHYAPVVETPDGPAKCEIRMMVVWKQGWERPQVVNNMCRLSKGEMVGVRYNKDKTWVGGTVCFFEP
jgi:hypothetical protein